jgi:hypothetical protein
LRRADAFAFAVLVLEGVLGWPRLRPLLAQGAGKLLANLQRDAAAVIQVRTGSWQAAALARLPPRHAPPPSCRLPGTAHAPPLTHPAA